jgi:hypothetical protein
MELKTRDELFTEKYGINPATIKVYFHTKPGVFSNEYSFAANLRSIIDDVNNLTEVLVTKQVTHLSEEDKAYLIATALGHLKVDKLKVFITDLRNTLSTLELALDGYVDRVAPHLEYVKYVDSNEWLDKQNEDILRAKQEEEAKLIAMKEKEEAKYEWDLF